MAGMTTENGKDRPYRPSWIDRFTDWVERLPVRGLAFYLGIGTVLVLGQILFLWLDGGLSAAKELLPIIIFNGLLTPFVLTLIYHLDRQATTALNTMRPTLEMTEPEFDGFLFRLSNMPAGAALMAGLIMLIIVILMEQVSTLPVRYEALEQLPIFSIVFQVVDKSSAFLLGVFVYHTARQLRLVNAINSNYTRISLFNLGPLQAFSKLTASTAVGLVVGIYGWMLINPDLLADPVSLAFVGLFTAVALVVFIWPLWGVHRLIEMEKAKMLHELGLHFEAAFSEFNQGVRDGDQAAMDRLNPVMAGLEIQHRRIAAIPTWPWRSETARFSLAAIILPLILTILQLLIAQAFSG